METNDIKNAYLWVRANNNTIPDDVLEFMKDCAIATLEGTIDGGWSASEKIHFRFCAKLVEVAKSKPVGMSLKDDPDMTRILSALEVLEECYPGLEAGIKEKMGF